MKNEQIRESSAIPAIIKAMEHDVSDAPIIDPVAAYKAVEEGVVGAYKAVEEGRDPAISGREALKIQKLICAIYESGKTGKTVHF